MPIDPRTGEQVDSLPSMDADGNVPTPRELKRDEKALKKQNRLMFDVLNQIHPPHPNSLLAGLDSAAFARETPSVIIMNALTSACAHLDSAHEFFKTKGANRITAWSLVRPALMSATTAGWIVAGTDLVERLRRSAVVSNEAMHYELTYADNIAKIAGAQVAERRAWVEARRADLLAWASSAGVPLRAGDRVPMTSAIKEVAAYVGAEEARISALWNEMSSGAHGLGWHVQTRTFGAGTSPLGGSNFVRFSIELDRANYFGAVADITDYATRVLTVAQTLATDAAVLAANGLLSTDEHGALVLRVDPSPLRRPD